MKRFHLLALIVLVTALSAMSSGCARQASVSGSQRLAQPSLADPVGSSGLSYESKSYRAADPP